jgi:hypothetical protein
MFRETLLEQAFTTIATHRPATDGTCRGCRADPTAGTALAPCRASREALAIVETHGVRQWDRPTSLSRLPSV